MEELRAKVRKYALENALRYEEAPKADAVLKMIFSGYPELRKDAKMVSTVVQQEIAIIASWSKEKQEEELDRIAPGFKEMLAAKKKEAKRAETGLPELPHAREGLVVMRFAPNPNGPPTLGSARGIVINSEYAELYNGKFILRFDDTDPALKRPLLEAYSWYLEDCAWLDAEPDELVVASERIDLYYPYAAELLRKGAAYVCFCPAETFKEYKDQTRSCPHRAVSVEENMECWGKMLKGDYEEKEAVLRIKTDMASADPALRDWVAFRVLKRDHPRVGARYVVWPTLDFESAIEDHLLGITHIIRGKDLMKSETRQRFLYDYLGWTYPITMHWGKIRVEEFGKFSTSVLRKGIEEGKYEGWDDPRLPTLRALRRRGFQPEAIRRFFISIGITQTDIAVSMKNLNAENRKMVDAVARRYFFVRNPVEMRLEGGILCVARALKHPSGKDYREIETGNTVYLSGDDYAKLRLGQKLRLKYLYTAEIESIEPLVARIIAVDTLQTVGMLVIQWAPTDGIKVTVRRPDGLVDEGIGEPKIATELGNVVQFERYGFVRIDSVAAKGTETEVVAYLTH